MRKICVRVRNSKAQTVYEGKMVGEPFELVGNTICTLILRFDSLLYQWPSYVQTHEQLGIQAFVYRTYWKMADSYTSSTLTTADV